MMLTLYPQVARQAPHYGRIACPVEIVHGEADALVPHVIHAGPLADRVADARLTLLPGVGHMPHHAAPEKVLAAADRLARRTATAEKMGEEPCRS